MFVSLCSPAMDLQLTPTTLFHYENYNTGFPPTIHFPSFPNYFRWIFLRFPQCKDRRRVSPALSGEAWQPLRTPLTQLCCKSTAFLIRVFQFACITTSLAGCYGGLYYSSGALCLPSRRFHRYLGPARLWQEGYKWAQKCDSSCACACVCSHTQTFFFNSWIIHDGHLCMKYTWARPILVHSAPHLCSSLPSSSFPLSTRQV